MLRLKYWSGAPVMILAFGCGGGATGAASNKVLAPHERSGKVDSHGQMVSKEAARNFDVALDAFVAHDKKGDWSAANCSAVADMFAAATKEQKSSAGKQLPEALYNMGLAYQRCGDSAKARAKYDEASAADPSFHRARGQIVLYEYQQNGDLDGAISKLDQIIRDAKFQNVEALVSLAALQMQRGAETPDQDGKNDLERAQRNLQRALAIDDAYMPAVNQLAIYYLEQAKAKANVKKQGTGRKRGMVVSGVAGVRVNEQQLDLAALVASQGEKKNPNYAPIYNTTGLILVELENFNGAVKAFGKARQLNPDFFEAHMNYAAVNLSFRGFEEAEKAYRQALKMRPNEYEAHLGLALALRGQINDSNFAKYVEDSQSHLDQAKKVAPDRAETYYNEAILTQEYRTKVEKPIPIFEKASQQYQDFVRKAGDDPAFAPAVKRSKERIKDIEDTVKFIKEGEQILREQQAAQAQQKQQAAPAPAAAPAKKP
jgi:tetratricopeptide (TPR) repeat protein